MSISDILNIDRYFWDFKQNVSRIFIIILNNNIFILMFIWSILQDG